MWSKALVVSAGSPAGRQFPSLCDFVRQKNITGGRQMKNRRNQAPCLGCYGCLDISEKSGKTFLLEKPAGARSNIGSTARCCATLKFQTSRFHFVSLVARQPLPSVRPAPSSRNIYGRGVSQKGEITAKAAMREAFRLGVWV